MPKIQHQIQLNADEIRLLEAVVNKGSEKAGTCHSMRTYLAAGASKATRSAHCDVFAGESEYCERHPPSLSSVGLPAALYEKTQPDAKRRLDGKQEAVVIVLACSDAPDGAEHWTMQLLADKLVELNVVESAISDETVRRT